MKMRFNECLEKMKSKLNFGDREKFYLILFFTFFYIFAQFKVQFNGYPMSRLRLLMVATSDSSLFTLICLFLRGKWKYVSLILPFLISILLFVNLLYHRYFEDLIPVQMYFNTHITDQTIIEAGKGAMLWYDFIPLVISVVPAVYAFIIGKKRFTEINADKKTFLIDGFLIIFSWSWLVWTTFNSEKRYFENLTLNKFTENLFISMNFSWRHTYATTNFTCYLIKCFAHLPKEEINLTGKKDQIKEYLSNKTVANSTTKELNDVRKNLIFIVVESFPSKLLEIDEIAYVAPFLARELRDEKTVRIECTDITALGNSSDAQFMYNTGLLPLTTEPLVTSYANHEYPSLPKALNIHSEEIIGENGYLWNHSQTSKSYGFNRLNALNKEDDFDCDSLIFLEAEKVIKRIPQPFYLFITTFSMHPGYKYKTVTPNLNAGKLRRYNEYTIEYLQRVNLLDRQLEDFIAYLKKEGLYDDSMIILAGDHVIRDNNKVDESLRGEKVPFIIMNSPTVNIKHREFSQIDLFPTILQLMGAKYSFKGVPYSGVGYSIFSDTYESLSPEDYEISEMLIKGSL